MQELSVLPTTIYEFDVPDEIYENTIEAYNRLNLDKSTRREGKIHYGCSYKGRGGLHKNKNFKKITTFANDKIIEVANKVKYNLFMEDIRVCLMWINVSETGRWHHSHIHPWSLLSGIVYLEGDSGKTWFSRKSNYELNPLMKVPVRNSLLQESNNTFEIIYKHTPKNKTMLIFPSTLTHSVDENKSEKNRVTLSFNSFAAKTVGCIDKLAGINFKDLC